MLPLLIASLSFLCLLIAAFALYLASPNQLLIKKKWSTKLLLAVFIIFLLCAFLLLIQILGTPTAVFTMFITLMLMWIFLPLLARFAHQHKKEKA